MKRRNFAVVAVITAAAAVVSAGLALPAFAQPITLHGASQFTDDHAFTKALVRFGELTQKYYGKPINFVLHKNSELGLEKDYFAYMNQGKAVDYAIVSPAHMSTFSKAAPFIDAPFLFRDLDHWNKVLDADLLKPIADEIAQKAEVMLVGYAGGLAETIFGRIVDAVITFPFLVLVIAIVSVLGPGLINMYIAVGVVGWVFYARIIAAEVVVQKRLDYADAGRAMGYSPLRVIFRHLLPNSITPAIVYLMTDMALAILLGSSLGYLGLGAQPPAAEWGVQIADGKNFMTTAWWISVFPGVAIVVTGLGFSLLGDGLAEVLRTRK